MKRSAGRLARGLPGDTSRGFTLIEVLVALTIIAVALMASLRATSTLTVSNGDMRLRTLAQWSAENRLARMRVQSDWPAVGRNSTDCSQGGARLTCEEAVVATPNPFFRRVEISVLDASDNRRMARLIGFVTTLP